jgi:hypothetical protein
MMKNWPYPIIIILAMCMLCLNAGADSIYTWTDAKGQTHITQEPPPQGARLKDTIEYVPKVQSTEKTKRAPLDFESQAPRTAPRRRDAGAMTEDDQRKVYYDGDGGRYTRRAIRSEKQEQGLEKPEPRPRPVKKRHRKR